MYPKLVHLYGSLSINSFGLCLAFSLMVFIYFVSKDSTLQKMLKLDDIINLTIYTALIGVISGRILYIITEFPKYESFWGLIDFSSGGSSVFGSFIGVASYLIFFAYKNNFHILELLDVVGIYVPIIHSISRVGCFLAGCCYGCETNLPWGITYTNPETVAPLYITIHPTQLYSAVIFFCIWLFMYFNFAKVKPQISGLIFSLYLIFSSLERLFIDFIRGDRTFLLNKYHLFTMLSFHQLIALNLLLVGFICLIIVNFKKNTVKA